MKAVIMAGGEGTRLRPLTCNIPKPMVPVLNRPMMEHILNLLKNHQIREIANTLWYMPEVIKGYFGDGSSRDVAMEYFVEDKPLGTAGSVKNAQGFLNEPFIVVSGDSLTDIDLSAAIKFHRSKGALATLVLTRVSNPLSYGVVITNNKGQITQFLEKPSWSEVFSDTVNTGIYILEPEVLDYVPDGDKYDFSQDLFPKLLEMQAPLYGYVAEGYWSDVGNLDVYRQAQQDCLDEKVRISLPEVTRPGIWMEAGAKVADDVEIQGPVYIGESATIGSNCFLGEYTVIGNYVQLESGVNIKRSTLWKGVQIGGRSQIRGAVLANNVYLGHDVQAYEGSVVGEKSRVGKFSEIAPNIKIWPAKEIGSGSHLLQSVVWGNQEQPDLFSANGVQGDIRNFLTPEMIAKFGLAFGGFVGKGNSVIVSCDGSKIGRITKRALISGLLAAGINVYDAGTVSGNLIRFGISYVQGQSGLHCQGTLEQSNQVTIQCWDKAGYWLSKGDQRKIENLLWREDFPRSNGAELGELAFVPDLIKQYITSIAKIYAPSLKGLRVKLNSVNSDLGELINQFLIKSKCSLTSDNPSLTINVNGDQWSIQDQNGKELNAEQWWTFFVDGLRSRDKKRVAVPIDVSQSVVKAANRHNMEVEWTKKDARSWMEIASELGNTRVDSETKVEHFPYVEPLASIGEILGSVNSGSISLDQIFNQEIPRRVEKSVLCPWESKGKVMRSLINGADPANTSFLDGLKYHHGQGWALIIPDGDDPVFHIYSEADSLEEADALTEFYTEQIESILQEEGTS